MILTILQAIVAGCCVGIGTRLDGGPESAMEARMATTHKRFRTCIHSYFRVLNVSQGLCHCPHESFIPTVRQGLVKMQVNLDPAVIGAVVIPVL